MGLLKGAQRASQSDQLTDLWTESVVELKCLIAGKESVATVAAMIVGTVKSHSTEESQDVFFGVSFKLGLGFALTADGAGSLVSSFFLRSNKS